MPFCLSYNTPPSSALILAGELVSNNTIVPLKLFTIPCVEFVFLGLLEKKLKTATGNMCYGAGIGNDLGWHRIRGERKGVTPKVDY